LSRLLIRTVTVLYKTPRNLTVFPQIASIFLDAPVLAAASRRSSLMRRAAPPRHVRSAVSQSRRARPRQRPPSPRISVRDAAALPDTPPSLLLLSSAATPPHLGGDRAPALLSSAGTLPLLGGNCTPALLLGGVLLQPVCRAAAAATADDDASSCQPPLRPPDGVRVPDGRPGRGGVRLADVSP
jgi:hypothetical protein